MRYTITKQQYYSDYKVPYSHLVDTACCFYVGCKNRRPDKLNADGARFMNQNFKKDRMRKRKQSFISDLSHISVLFTDLSCSCYQLFVDNLIFEDWRLLHISASTETETAAAASKNPTC